MNRTGLLITLAVAAAVGLIFGVFPDLDLRIASYFYAPPGPATFALRHVIMVLRDGGMWLITALVLPAVLALAVKLALPRSRFIMSGRAALFLTLTMALGPGILVNGIAKDNWPRSRPIEVRQLGGPDHFVAWWDPRGDCPKNCSFVSGDVSAAIWTLAPAALVPPAWRPLAYGTALVFAAGIGLQRMLLGGHFFTDVVFAGVFTFLIVWLVYALLYRWRAALFSDEALERALMRLLRPRSVSASREPELQRARATEVERT